MRISKQNYEELVKRISKIESDFKVDHCILKLLYGFIKKQSKDINNLAVGYLEMENRISELESKQKNKYF